MKKTLSMMSMMLAVFVIMGTGLASGASIYQEDFEGDPASSATNSRLDDNYEEYEIANVDDNAPQGASGTQSLLYFTETIQDTDRGAQSNMDFDFGGQQDFSSATEINIRIRVNEGGRADGFDLVGDGDPGGEKFTIGLLDADDTLHGETDLVNEGNNVFSDTNTWETIPMALVTEPDITGLRVISARQGSSANSTGWEYQIDNFEVIPEPSTLMLLGLGGLLLMKRRRV